MLSEHAHPRQIIHTTTDHPAKKLKINIGIKLLCPRSLAISVGAKYIQNVAIAATTIIISIIIVVIWIHC